jgi:hypothetical protein
MGDMITKQASHSSVLLMVTLTGVPVDALAYGSGGIR